MATVIYVLSLQRLNSLCLLKYVIFSNAFVVTIFTKGLDVQSHIQLYTVIQILNVERAKYRKWASLFITITTITGIMPSWLTDP